MGFPEEKFGPANGLRTPDSQNGIRIPVLPSPVEKFGPIKGIKIPDSQNGIRIPVLPSPVEKFGHIKGIKIPDLPSPVEKFGPIKGIKIPDLPSPVEKYGPTNGLRIPDYHPYTPTRKNTDQLTDLESQTITTKKDTQRVTTTQLDAFQQEEDQDASEDADQDVTEEDHTPRDAVSTTSSVKMVELHERTNIFENTFIFFVLYML